MGRGRIPWTGNNEWYTPPRLVKAARQALGGIDLDPASCATANRIVRAERYYTREDDGLSREWAGRVYMNCPYGRVPGIGEFVGKLSAEVAAGRVSAWIALVPCDTSTRWAQSLIRLARRSCFLVGRVHFLGPDLTRVGRGVVGHIVYGGGPSLDVREFVRAFDGFGCIMRSLY